MLVNKNVANILRDVATIKEASGDNKFSVGAYRKAATFVSNLPAPITDLDLQNTKGIGPKIAACIKEYLSTGNVQFIIDNQSLLAPNSCIEDLLRIEGIGEKKAMKIYEATKISTVDQLKVAIEDGSIYQVLKPKTVENIKRGIEYLETTRGRIRLEQAIDMAMQIAKELQPHYSKIEFCGSFRRSKETVGDLDFAVISSNDVLGAFTRMPMVDKVIDAGDKKASVWINGVRVDCYAFLPEDFGSGVMHLTGSDEHNKTLRGIAKSRGLLLSQYGLWAGAKRLDNGTEEDIYNQLGFHWIPPEHREGLIEFDRYQLSNARPTLLGADDVQYDFHVHSTWSDGRSSIEQLVNFAQQQGLKGIAVTDHSQSLAIAHGLSLQKMKEKMDEIEVLRGRYPSFKLLMGTEVDIKSDGSLDYPDEILDRLDIVIASIHTNTKQDVTEIYKKVIRSGKVHILGHLTGRMINERPGHELNIEEVLQECKYHNVAMEFNCQPNRLDVDEQIMQRCKSLGVKIAFGSDAHEKSQIIYVKTFGVWIGRRAWLTKDDLFTK